MEKRPVKTILDLPEDELRKIEARFWSKVEKTEGCWNWTSALSKDYYGLFEIKYQNFYAHRVAFELVQGSIPEGMTLDHLCRNPTCVNPNHLEAVSMKENVMRGFSPSSINAKKKNCPKGHKLSSGSNQRICVICRQESVKAWRQRNWSKCLEQMRQYRALHKEQINAQARKRYRQISYWKKRR